MCHDWSRKLVFYLDYLHSAFDSSGKNNVGKDARILCALASRVALVRHA